MILNEPCEACHATNYVDLGDMEDVTGVDYEGFQCWSCNKQNLFEGWEDMLAVSGCLHIAKGREETQ